MANQLYLIFYTDREMWIMKLLHLSSVLGMLWHQL